MKTLKESILNRSSHGGDASKKRMIEEWLKEYNIKNYIINDDFTIDVDGFVYISNKNLKELPEYIQFGVVKSEFSCAENRLISLKGCPKEVGASFYCYENKLKSLEGAPEKVGGDFYCNYNDLISLEGAPKEVRLNFLCDCNDLISLEGAPKKLGGNFYCDYNKLTTLKGAPKEIGGEFKCNKNSTQFTEDDVRKVCDVGGKITV